MWRVPLGRTSDPLRFARVDAGDIDDVGAIILNAVLLVVALTVIAVSVRSRSRARRDPALEVSHRPDYVPRFWPTNGPCRWIARSPQRMLGWLVLVPAVGVIAGVVLAASHDRFGLVLVLASLIGAARTFGWARRALTAARRRSD